MIERNMIDIKRYFDIYQGKYFIDCRKFVCMTNDHLANIEDVLEREYLESDRLSRYFCSRDGICRK